MVKQFSGFTIDNSRFQYSKSSRESTLNLVRTNEKHLVGTTDKLANTIAIQNLPSSFGNLLLKQLDGTSDLVKKAEDLTKQFLTNPDSVNEHDLTITSTEATLAVNITTNIIQKALESYRTIISLQ